MTLTSRVRDWESAGDYVELAGRQVFVRCLDGAGPLVVLLHGYPSSSYDWRGVLPALAGRNVLAFDFLGFGLSAKPRLPHYSLLAQADLAERLVSRFAGSVVDGADKPDVLVVAHDMGTSVTSELMARDLEGRLGFDLRAVLLFNGSMVVEAADQRSLLAHAGGNRILDRLTHYLHERVEYAPRWHGAIRDWPGRLELCWAGQDPICVEDVLQALLALRPEVPLTRWPGLGHYPQVEDPATVAAAIVGYADR